MTSLKTKPFSADAHTIEPPYAYADFVEAKFKDRVPKLTFDENRGALYQIETIPNAISISSVCMGDIPHKDRPTKKIRPFEKLLKGGYQAKDRLADQDRDGVAGEIIYPSLGMVICQSQDADFRHAMLWAYNRWLQEFCAEDPKRLVGVPQLAIRSVEEGIKELKEAKRMGFRTAMLPGDPLTEEDYDHKVFDPFWETAVELEMPLGFHSLTSARSAHGNNIQQIVPLRGSQVMAAVSNIVRSNQDIIGMLIWGGVFDRFPDLRMVCVEADASWGPHLMLKWDQAYISHRNVAKHAGFKLLPSEMFRQNMYMTFQYDWVAIKMGDLLNPERLMWANDYPHSDGTWPNSKAILEENLPDVPQRNIDRILHDNCVELYGLA